MTRFARLAGIVLAGWLLAAGQTSAQSDAKTDRPDPAQIEFFEKHIRPVLVKECYSCHSAAAEEIQGNFTLDTRAGFLQGGDLGPAIVPGNARRSLLIKALRHSDDLQMPPEKKLPAEVVTHFEKWIAMGAPDPREGAPAVAEKYEIDIEKGRQFWAFQPPKKIAPPKVKNDAWAKTDIDRYLLAAMATKGLRPVADADVHTLLRRIYFDLIGLPPTPKEVEYWASRLTAPGHRRQVVGEARDVRTEANSNALAVGSRLNEEAVAELVDKLLESPRFGERWGRHWLDVARYAESSGQSSNVAYPHAWRYRDWVIDALNNDMPYDQFVRRQLAGDLLDAADKNEKAANLVATGFLAIGPKSHNERNRQQFRMDLADEQIDATFQAFQGLTVACARCHDHKFDPIPQTDYYAVAGIFLSTETRYGTIRIIQSNQPSRLWELPEDAEMTMPLAPLSEARRTAIEEQIAELRKQIAETRGRDNFIRVIFVRSRITQLQSQLDQYDSEGNPKALAMGVNDRILTSDSRVYVRGELDQPGERVRRGFPQVLSAQRPEIPRSQSGRRELADWIASPENPLTARVMANRVWVHLIGRGLVSTPDNFGASGQTPSHPELLDHLAISFVENGWSVKKLIREIMLSRTYQLSSQFNNKNFETDPDNVLVWRMPKRRLEAEALRDTMLQLGGRLDLDTPEGSPVARNGEGNVRVLFRSDPSTTETYRSVYLPIVRDQVPEALTLFDFPDPSLIIGQRETTTIPAQSLFLMNSSFVIRQAEGLSASLLARRLPDDGAEGVDLEEEMNVERIRQAYASCFSRPPTDTEINAGLKFLEDYGRLRSQRAAWAALCQALFASAEFSQR